MVLTTDLDYEVIGLMRKYSPKGFTLVELLVVIAIIAILASVGVVQYGGTQKGARDAKRRADVDAISKALETHYNSAVNQYCIGNGGSYCNPDVSWFSGGVPKDPSTGADYDITPKNADGTPNLNGSTTYSICADLETSTTDYCKTQQQ